MEVTYTIYGKNRNSPGVFASVEKSAAYSLPAYGGLTFLSEKLKFDELLEHIGPKVITLLIGSLIGRYFSYFFFFTWVIKIKTIQYFTTWFFGFSVVFWFFKNPCGS